ncbi:hypothetical protein G7Z17_g2402 [Cylindrodendrum hubeiense]|uniref:Mg2+ transporter protein, CorA-like/Zinc transport protein ZntB n=1 Tax=Cylindrodendrum hubeiense TaxID=595255 RepID=A0A9P5HN89_9HYPO|nr:hypothetical protein G7Z17_g2402 [Cylindrodendrum hubeiense]
MAFWIDSNPPSEILKKTTDDQWIDDGSSKVIQPGTGLSRGISDWLREQSAGNPGTTTGDFLIIPQDDDKCAATYQQMDALARIWKIPSPVFGVRTRLENREVVVDIRHIAAAIYCLEGILSDAVKQHSQDRIEFQRFLDAMRFFKTKFCSLVRSWVDLSTVFITLRTKVNNSKFIRTNTISIRRLDEQNSLEAERLRVLTRNSAQDARDMKRIATLTMIFLPSTVVAAFFSTPFMTLDEGLNFKALSKVWIFFLASGVVTLLTFGVSWTWDTMVRWRQFNNVEENESPQSEIHDPDKVVLEPEPGQLTGPGLVEEIFKGWEEPETDEEDSEVDEEDSEADEEDSEADE